jgi:uncharacterized protein (TIGR03382 family)
LSAEVGGFHVAFIGGGVLFVAGLLAAVALLRERHLAHMATSPLVAEAA